MTSEILLPSGITAEIAPFKTADMERTFTFKNFNPALAYRKSLSGGVLKRLGKNTHVSDEDIAKMSEVDVRFCMLQARILSYPIDDVLSVTYESKGKKYSGEFVINMNEFEFRYSEKSQGEEIYQNYEDIPDYEDFCLPVLKKVVRLHRITLGLTKQIKQEKEVTILSGLKSRNPLWVREDGNVERIDDLAKEIESLIDSNFLFKKALAMDGALNTTKTIYSKDGDSMSIDLLVLPSFFYPALSVV